MSRKGLGAAEGHVGLGTHQRYLVLLDRMAGAGEGLEFPGYVVGAKNEKLLLKGPHHVSTECVKSNLTSHSRSCVLTIPA